LNCDGRLCLFAVFRERKSVAKELHFVLLYKSATPKMIGFEQVPGQQYIIHQKRLTAKG